jgi:hypothetical protein
MSNVSGEMSRKLDTGFSRRRLQRRDCCLRRLPCSTACASGAGTKMADGGCPPGQVPLTGVKGLCHVPRHTWQGLRISNESKATIVQNHCIQEGCRRRPTMTAARLPILAASSGTASSTATGRLADPSMHVRGGAVATAP